MKRIGILGVPSSAGARQKGQEKAPQALRNASLVEIIRRTGLDVKDFGDLPEVSYRPDRLNPRHENLDLAVQVVKEVSRRVHGIVQQGYSPLVLGGDCTITLGVLDGIIRKDPTVGLIYFDGDVDLNTPDSTLTGALDGMGVAHMIGKGEASLSHAGSRFPFLTEDRIVLFGHSAESGWIDEKEIERLSESQLVQYPLGQIRGKAADWAARAGGHLGNDVHSILVHLDVDVIDFHDFPVADVPHHKGMTFDEAMEVLTVFLSGKRVSGLVITEFNVNRDLQGVQARRLADALGRVLTHASGRADNHSGFSLSNGVERS